MSKVAVVWWSGTGNTEQMANAVIEGAQELATWWRPCEEMVGGAAPEEPDRAQAIEQQRRQGLATRRFMLEERDGEDHGPAGRHGVRPPPQQWARLHWWLALARQRGRIEQPDPTIPGATVPD